MFNKELQLLSAQEREDKKQLPTKHQKESRKNHYLNSPEKIRIHSKSTKTSMSHIRRQMGRENLFTLIFGRRISVSNVLQVIILSILTLYGLILLLLFPFSSILDSTNQIHGNNFHSLRPSITVTDIIKEHEVQPEEINRGNRNLIPKSSVLWLSDGEPNAEKDWRRIVQVSVSRILPTGGVIHIIHSEFVSQGNTIADLAQVELFKTFTLPSMESQIKLNFIWIIELSDKISEDVVSALKDTLDKCPTVFLIRNKDLLQVSDTKVSAPFRDKNKLLGLLNNSTNSLLYGDESLLDKYVQSSRIKGKIVLETTLPFASGLPRQFVNYIQQSVKNRFAEQLQWLVNRTDVEPYDIHNEQIWSFWCVDKQFDWYVDANLPFGFLAGNLSSRCVFPGSTSGYIVHVGQHNKMPKTHNKLSTLDECETPHQMQCVDTVQDISFGAVIPHTPIGTTDMVYSDILLDHENENVDVSKSQVKRRNYIRQLQWTVAHKRFRVFNETAGLANKFFLEHKDVLSSSYR